MDAPDYLDHFRLQSAPFAAAPDALLFHAHGARGELLGALAYALTHGDGIVKITGEAGSGMTMLCHALARQLAGQAIIIHMEPASLGPLGVIHATSMALGLDPDGKRSDEVLRLMQGKLAAMRAGGRHAVLMADHADLLPPGALEEIRLLTNLADEQGALMQIVLLGQPALNASLRQPAMRQIRERISLSFVMPPLTPDDVPALLAHRLGAVGYQGLGMFATDAARLLAAQAKGDLRKLMQLAQRSLEAAANEGAVSITARHVQAAIRGRLPAWRPRGLRPAMAGAAAAVAVLGVGAAAFLVPRTPASVTANAAPKSTPITNRMGNPITRQAPAMAATQSATPSPDERPASLPLPAMAASSVSVDNMQPAAAARIPGQPPAASAAAPLPAAPAPRPAGAAPDNTAPAPSAPAAQQRAAAPQMRGTPATATAVTVAAAIPAVAPPAPANATTSPATMMAAGAAVGDAGATASTPAGKPSSLLQQTLKATQTWLRDEPDSHLSIKIEDFPAAEQARIEAFLAEARGAIGLRDVHAYPTLNNGVHRIGIAYGSFNSEQQAEKAMAGLKGQLRSRYAPKTRTIGAIRVASARAQHALQAASKKAR